MPKKAPKNAFFYFMQDFKEQQRKKGINYGSLADVAKDADPEWRNAPPKVKAHFEAIAKQEREKRNVPVAKFTSTGLPFSEIERKERELQEAIETEVQEIKNIVKTKAFDQSILDEDFYLMDVNYYCKAGNMYVIGESTVLRFNLRNGFRDFYHEKINPEYIPLGYASDIKFGSIDYGMEMPDEFSPRSNLMQMLANIIDYLKQKDPDVRSGKKRLPPVFTMPEKVEPVRDFFLQMCLKAGEDEFQFRIYRLDTLFFHLINNIKTHNREGFPKESLALVVLRKDPFKYTPGLGCEHHEEGEKAVECTTSRTKRWCYTILDSCCPVAGIDIKPGQHVPEEFDVEGILKFKDMKKVWSPSITCAPTPSSSCNSTVNESFFERQGISPSSSVIESVKKEKRIHAPLRMPQTDYSKNIRPAPDLTEEQFPALCAGRGRGLAGSFSKMNLRK